jgi:hypothetical protein
MRTAVVGTSPFRRSWKNWDAVYGKTYDISYLDVVKRDLEA